MGEGRVQLLVHPLSSPSLTFPHQHGPFGVLSGAVVGGAIKSWWDRQAPGHLVECQSVS